MELTLLHWLLAGVPTLALIVLMVVRNWSAQEAGAITIFITAAIAYFAFGTPVDALLVASAKGTWDALPILYVIWPALLLYHVMSKSGGYDALRHGISGMSQNEIFIIVALGWVLPSFLQGIDGFGTPIAVVAPLLVAFGVRPIYAVAIPIIAHIWAKFFGTLGVGWLATLQVVELDAATATSMGVQAGLLMILQALLGGFTIVWMYGRWPAIRASWPLVLIIGLIQGIGQTLMVWVDPILAAFLPATVALIALFPLSRIPRYRLPAQGIEERPAMVDGTNLGVGEGPVPPMGTGMALAPYGLLTVLALGTSLIGPLAQWLDGPKFGLAFPQLGTGMGPGMEATSQYAPLHPFSHPGAVIAVTALVAWIVYAGRGYFDEWSRRTGKVREPIVPAWIRSSAPASVPIIAFLIVASTMKFSGQTQMLALGIAAVASPYVFAFFANGLGIISAFITSSSTSAQVLMSELQLDLAKANGLPPATILGAQAAGGAIGNAIAPANVVMGASTAGASGQEGAILRKTIPWTVAAFVLTGIATVVLALITG
ncbi:L-lactate permease [Shinella daejeonensis]|uniref:L-lactate permease n=1 Tax=Shinella daejeonensis TaxID=659017 RepID=UPI0020C7F6DB|nr:L-lactate permease [Shinella daejeonensis]